MYAGPRGGCKEWIKTFGADVKMGGELLSVGAGN